VAGGSSAELLDADGIVVDCLLAGWVSLWVMWKLGGTYASVEELGWVRFFMGAEASPLSFHFLCRYSCCTCLRILACRNNQASAF